MYELYIEGQRADIDQKISVLLNYAIDDIREFGSRNTSFSKTIVLPGTAINNRIFGHTQELGSFNDYAPGAANVLDNFNSAQPAKAEIRFNGLLIIKGVFRLTKIIKIGKEIEYEGSVFGELAGFVAAIGLKKLEDLDFSELNHDYTVANIVQSWGGVSKNKIITFNASESSIEFSVLVDPEFRFDFSIGDTIFITNSTLNDGTYTITNITYTFTNRILKLFVAESVVDENDNCTIRAEKLGGYYYPLIDYGNVSTNKIDYQYTAFRPSIFVKEYMDRIFFNAGYTYESEFFNGDLFKKLAIPLNTKIFEKLDTKLIDAYLPEQYIVPKTPFVVSTTQFIPQYNESALKLFIIDNQGYKYTGSQASINVNINISGSFIAIGQYPTFPNEIWLSISLIKNNDLLSVNNYFAIEIPDPNNIYTHPYYNTTKEINITYSETINISTNDYLYIQIENFGSDSIINTSTINVVSLNPVLVPVAIGDSFLMNESIPKNILQKDFFTWIMKMFNLYVDESKADEKKLIIKPYIDYYNNTTYTDWTYKVARDKPMQITPMGILNARFLEYKYKQDNDFYNEGYQKKFNLPYGSNLQDTGFQFAKDKQAVEIGFSPTVIVQYDVPTVTDKTVPAILKKSGGVGTVDEKEDSTDSNIRILMVKRIEGVDAWDILDGEDVLSGGNNLTAYGYAGHVDDPDNPTIDINFGVPNEIFFNPTDLTTNTLFNTYWSSYIAEIADKDSKLMSCHVYLTPIEIAQLDFSIPIFIDGVLWRLNKVEDYDAQNNELVKVELLRIIDVKYQRPCITGWTTRNYEGTRFRNGDEIPQVTDPDEWAALTTPGWCYYDNDPANGAIYGKLYNWYAINDPRGFAPVGYRVPTKDDWQVMIDCLGGDEIAGGKLKSLELWNSPNTGATNESGFNGLPAGSRFVDGTFYSILNNGTWWTSTENLSIYGWVVGTSYNNENIYMEYDNKSGLSVRLIKE